MAGDDFVRKNRIAIVGAGCSGLAAIKCCLDEGLEPVCLEKGTDIGGLWNFSPYSTPGSASIYSSLVINTSKNMMMFSDFPPPEHFPPFLTHSKVLDYFRLYADHFRLFRHIRFSTEVKHVTKSSDYETTGKWDVTFKIVPADGDGGTTRGHESGDVVSETFDGVMVCTGHHSVPYLPYIPGLDNFQGKVLHSHSYKDATPFQGQRVVILGLGNSAVDIACDLAKTAQQVTISSRRGAWLVPRTAFWSLPADMMANSRVVFTLPYKMLDWFVQRQANLRIDHTTYGLKPEHGVLNCHPTINDELPIHLVSGRVIVKPSIQRVEPRSVSFEDNTSCPCDVIILATGYEYRVDVLDEKVLRVENNKCRLFKYVFPPHLPQPTLAVIGLVQAIGAVMPIAEMQCRWFARVMTGAVKLPNRQAMLEDIERKEAMMNNLYVKSRRHTLQTFWIDYMDQVASEIGARPCLWKVLGSDPELALKCFLGPCLPAQYRLMGPGSWTGARAFIINAFSKMTKSKTTSRVSSCKTFRIDQKDYSTSTLPCEDRISISIRESKAYLTQSLSPFKIVRHPRILFGSQGRQENRRTLSSEWTTLTLYLTIISICSFAWLLSVLFDQAVDSVLDRQANASL